MFIFELQENGIVYQHFSLEKNFFLNLEKKLRN